MILLALTALVGQAPAAPTPTVVAAVVPANERAEALATLSFPPETMLALNLRGWEQAFRAGSLADPQMRSIENAHPGALDAAVAAGRPVAREYLSQAVQRYHQLRVKTFAERMSAADLDMAAAFFGSPAGRRFTQGVLANLDTSGMAKKVVADAVKNGKLNITTGMANAAAGSAVRAATARMTAEDNLAIMRFETSAAGKRFAALSVELDQVALKEANNPDPAWLARQNEVVRAAVVAFVDGKR